jgi:hypothetical protein
MRSAAMKVRNRGLGNVMIERQKMKRMESNIHCPSYIDHRCFRRARIVSEGDKEVSNCVMAVVGDEPRILALVALHFRRIL